MATVWVRYANGDEGSWHLTDEVATDLKTFVANMGHAGSVGNIFSFPVMPEEGMPGTDYGFVTLKMDHLVAWHIDGLINAAAAAALWAEMQDGDDDDKPS